MKNIYLILICTIALTFTGKAQTETFFPTDDMTTNEGNSGMAPGNDQIWIANWDAMQNYHQTIMKFDLSSFGEESVNSAVLNLNQFFHAPDGSPTPAKVYIITEEWNENDWSTNTNVTFDESFHSEITFTSELGWYEIDVTEHVNSWLNNPGENFGLVIIANSGTKFSEFWSKDTEDETVRPNLVIESSMRVSEMDNQNFETQVFPNPASQELNVTIDSKADEEVRICLYDISGCLVKEAISLTNTQSSIIVSDLNSGLYLLTINSKAHTYTEKIVIQ
jgi:hypothetical protein